MATNPIKPYGGHKTYALATVTTEADGLSDIIDIGGLDLKTIQMSTSGWTNAGVTFLGSAKTPDEMMSIKATTAAADLTYATTANQAVAVDSALFEGFRYLQVRSGTSAVPVAQAVSRELILGLDRKGK